MVKNGQKWPKIEFSDLSRENGVVIVWSSSLSIDIIATALSGNSYVSESGGGINGWPMSRKPGSLMRKLIAEA